MNTNTTLLSLPPSRRHHRSVSIISDASTVPETRSEFEDDTLSVLSATEYTHTRSVTNLVDPPSASANEPGHMEFDDSFYNTFENLSTRTPADLVSSLDPVSMQMDMDEWPVSANNNGLMSPAGETDTSSTLPSPGTMDSPRLDPPWLSSNDTGIKTDDGIRKSLDTLTNHQTFVSGRYANVQPMSQQQLQEQLQYQQHQQQLLEQYRTQVQAFQRQSAIPQPNIPLQPQLPHEYNTRHKQFHLPENVLDSADDDMVDDAATIVGEESEPSDSDKDDFSADDDDDLDSSDSEYVEGYHTGTPAQPIKSPQHGHRRSASDTSAASSSSKSIVSNNSFNNTSITVVSAVSHSALVAATPNTASFPTQKPTEKPVRRRKGLYTPIRDENGNKRFLCPKCDTTFKRSHDLTRHIRALHEEGGKPFVCQQCKRAFNRGDALRRHQQHGRPCHLDEVQ